ncbi:LysR family transcriptional regulator [Actinoallomurus sp. CA-142502]|uniref:LysR family transcriptional regulator n=1 Tax=Actinoallomurus sp. CA-142502 TaxID=3239885 RepID=UPI003D8E90BC
MQLRHVESFLAVVEEGQFARAASRLFLSPPAVTGHVRRLERELGVPLLHRSPVSLTEAGARFLPHAQAMVTAANAASAAVKDLHGARDAVIRVGVMTPGAAELTPAILRAFCRAQPRTRLTVESLGFTDFLSAVLEHRVDVAFVRPAPDDERVVTDTLTVEPRILLTLAAGDLAHADGVRLDDVLDLRFVRFPETTPRLLSDYGSFAAARNGMDAHWGVGQATSAQDLMTSIAAGWGVAGTLQSLGRYYRSPGTCAVPVVDAPWEASALVSRRDDLRPEIRAFRDLAVALARDPGLSRLRPPVAPER